MTAAQIATIVRNSVDGTVATELSRDGEEIDVAVKIKGRLLQEF